MKILVPFNKETTISELPISNLKKFVFSPGDERILNFLHQLSLRILHNGVLKRDATYVSLAFWLRKSNLKKILKENNLDLLKETHQIKPVGTVFHLCPSNVDTMFFYSLTLALLAGNKNVVRVSSRLESVQVFALFELINTVVNLEQFKDFEEYINIVSYERDDVLNEKFSLAADARIIWGGDKTIEQFKAYATRSRVKDLYFADRISFSIINVSERLPSDTELNELGNQLYNDVYTFDQMGCSSPHCLFFIGDKLQSKKMIDNLYSILSKHAESKYDRDIVSMASYKFNKSVEDILEGNSNNVIRENNYLTLSELTSEVVGHSCGMGYLYYKQLDELEVIISYFNTKLQTIGYWGFSAEDLIQLSTLAPPNSVDRIVPIGKALEFDYIWDGYNIFLELLNFKTLRA